MSTYPMIFLNWLISFFKYLSYPLVPQRVIAIKSIAILIFLFFFALGMDFVLDHISSSAYLLNTLKITDKESLNNEIYKEGFAFAFIVVGIIVPIFEEITQRYYLTSFVWNNALLPLILGYILIKLFDVTNTGEILMVFIPAITFSVIIYQMLNRSSTIKTKFLKFYFKNYWLYFYTSAIAFGIAHIGNYPIKHFVPILPIMLVFPQIFAGMLLGYIRITMGISWSIMVHSIHNIVLLIILFSTHH